MPSVLSSPKVGWLRSCREYNAIFLGVSMDPCIHSKFDMDHLLPCSPQNLLRHLYFHGNVWLAKRCCPEMPIVNVTGIDHWISLIHCPCHQHRCKLQSWRPVCNDPPPESPLCCAHQVECLPRMLVPRCISIAVDCCRQDPREKVRHTLLPPQASWYCFRWIHRSWKDQCVPHNLLSWEPDL